MKNFNFTLLNFLNIIGLKLIYGLLFIDQLPVYSRVLSWDATCVNTLAPSYIDLSSKYSGKVAANATTRKKLLYTDIIQKENHIFIRFAVETMNVKKERISSKKLLKNWKISPANQDRNNFYYRESASLFNVIMVAA